MKLKQKLALGLGVFYLFSVIGIALSMHFCGGSLASVSVYKTSTACNLCKEEPINKKDDTCCKNTHVEVKIKDSHQAESLVKLPKAFSILAFFPPRISELFTQYLPVFFSETAQEAPPRTPSVSLQVLHCVFRN
ncbi:MAG: hypothetical protein V4541_05770 [Bacteroidota bacterium]